ncbi:hypothetical protein ILUMI_10895 [Ignelater luminosus]|uniref:Uncharacterized protein n=1 Tax=Ignelater luminosus TaxID=2038154 RepID=A0A8K0CX97_IGNLU|nr:hypothetical protein ILUMI_10895 [Ignelater luminosus]
MFEIPEWPDHTPVWSHGTLQLLVEATRKQSEDVTLDDILENSKSFPLSFPISSVRCKTLSQSVTKDFLERNINSAYPILHENALHLYVNFLMHKRKFGSAKERELYANMSILELIQRLLLKRAAIFVSAGDHYRLLDGTLGSGQWERIGTDNEPSKINLNKCLSYDELKLSALLSVSSYSSFINDGNRYNEGITTKVNIESDGIIIGLIGTRLEKPKVMEFQEIIIAEDQNHEGNGYGTQALPTMPSLFSGFYGEVCFTYRQLLDYKNTEPTRFTEVDKGIFFDNNVYCKRIILSIDTLLLEANQKAKERNMTAVVHVVGIGLGVWEISPHQDALFLDTFAKRIQTLGSKKSLDHVSDVIFAYFPPNATSGGHKNGDLMSIPEHPNRGIKIHILKREPHTKLTGELEGKLLVVSYAWDGNALPGNEFWAGDLNGSGDPAAASSTQVSELHNPHINPKVCADNLRIATPSGVLSLTEYCEIAKRG